MPSAATLTVARLAAGALTPWFTFETVGGEAKDQVGLDVNLEGMLDVLDEIHHDGNGKVRFHYVLIG